MSDKLETLLWKSLKDKVVQCRLCAHFCLMKEGESGRCGVRLNLNGVLQSLVLDNIASINMDPVEKKPLFHFLPGTQTLSFGSLGCNMSCLFCQNWSISQLQHTGSVQGDVPGIQRQLSLKHHQMRVTPRAIVDEAKNREASSISYTYNEPTMFYELMRATATLAKAEGLANIMVSNGFQSEECLDGLQDLIDAANIDLKAFSDDFYRNVCGARLDPVLKNLKRMRSYGWWLEVTTLLIPDQNDSAEEMEKLAGFIANELGPSTPWHISAFHPSYKMMDVRSTPVSSVQKAIEVGLKAGLEFVYAGNVPGHDSESTRCPACQELFAKRYGYVTSVLPQKPDEQGRSLCVRCGNLIAGVWDKTQLRRIR